VGLEKGLTMMLRSKNIKADEGAKAGLIDLVVPTPDAVLPAAKALALEIAAGKRPKVQALKKGDKLPNMMARCGTACVHQRVACADGAGVQAINFILTTAREEASKARGERCVAHTCMRALTRLRCAGGEAHDAPAGVHRRRGGGHRARRRGGHQEGRRAVQGASEQRLCFCLSALLC
jgi:enoyl-CoA hydratase/carnithine racemase